MQWTQVLRSALTIVVLVLGGCQHGTYASRNPSSEQNPRTWTIMRLYDQDGNSTCVLTWSESPINYRQDFKHDDNQTDYKNDHAATAELEYFEAGTKIWLYSDPGCSKDEDWAEILIKKTVPHIFIGNFNYLADTPEFDFEGYDSPHDKRAQDGTRSGKSGIDVGGAVSCLWIDGPGKVGQRRRPVPHHS